MDSIHELHRYYKTCLCNKYPPDSVMYMPFTVTVCSGLSNVKRKTLYALQLEARHLACRHIFIYLNGTINTQAWWRKVLKINIMHVLGYRLPRVYVDRLHILPVTDVGLNVAIWQNPFTWITVNISHSGTISAVSDYDLMSNRDHGGSIIISHPKWPAIIVLA